jgi:hypothetical protein
MTDSEFRALEGNPDLVRSKADRYAELADAITRSVTTLNAIKSTEGMTSKAIDKVREEAGKVADDIGKAQTRYSGTAQALITYSAQLRSAQDAADTAISHINDKETAAETASRAATSAATKAESATPETATTETAAATRAETAADAAGQALAAAHQEWHSALDVKNQAAQTAIGAILNVIDGKAGEALNDTWWDDWGKAALDILKTVCEWAGVLAIFFSWVPFLGQILLVLAVIGAVITLIEATIKAVNGGNWGDVAFAAVGVVLSVFGGNIAKYAGKLVKAKGLTAAMKLPRKQFTTLTGIPRSQKAAQLKDVQAMLGSPKKLPNVMKEVFGTNPLKISEKNLGAAWQNYRRNPLGIQGFDNPVFTGAAAAGIPTGASVFLGVMNYRSLAGKAETITNNPFNHDDRGMALKPESILKDLSHGDLPKLTPG